MFKLWLESLKTKDFIQNTPLAGEVSEWLLDKPQIRSFLQQVDNSAIVKPLKIGKTGTLVLSKASQYQLFGTSNNYENSSGNNFQHRIPVKITGLEDNQVRLERTDGKDFTEIAYLAPYFPDYPTKRSRATVELPASRIIIVDQEKYLTYLRWITYAVTKGAQDNKSKIPSYFNKFWSFSESGLIRSLGNPDISKLKTTDLPPDYFSTLDELPTIKKDNRGGKGDVGRTIVEFPNGFKWISLDRESCRAEADAGGHCGNTGGPTKGDNVLSLRDKDNRVYLTFIINNGVMGEMKANGNKKPNADFHPYIIKLLEDPMVKKIGHAKYLPENNFQISDLDYNNLMRLSKTRPDLTDIDKFDITLIKNRNNIGKFLGRLIEKYPHLKELQLASYDFDKKAFKIGSSMILSGHGRDWMSQAWGIINDNNIDFREGIEIIKEHFNDLSTETLVEFSKYFLENIDKIDWNKTSQRFYDVFIADKEKAKEILKRPKELDQNWFSFFATGLIEKDQNFRKFMQVTYQDAYRESAAEEVNKDLKEKSNKSDVFYQLSVGKKSEVVATKYISKKEIRKLLRNPKEISQEVKVTLGNINVEVRNDLYMNFLAENTKYFHYKFS